MRRGFAARSGSAIRSAAGSSSNWPLSRPIASSGPRCSIPQSSCLPHVGFDFAERERADRAFDSVEDAIAERVATGVPTPREHLEEEMREHLVQHSDGRWRFRYCQAAVVSMYGELTTPPPPPETLRAQTLLVHAGEFGLVREDQIDAYRAALGDLVEVVEVPGGHIVYWDAYEETADAVERFLQDSRAQ